MIVEMTDDELRDKALAILTEQLGLSHTIRFLSWLRSKPRDYQAWRDAQFHGQTAADLIAKMRALEAGNQV